VVNTLIQVVHGCVEAFEDVDEKQDLEISAVKEMVLRSEERQLAALEAYRVEMRRELDVLARSWKNDFGGDRGGAGEGWAEKASLGLGVGEGDWPAGSRGI